VSLYTTVGYCLVACSALCYGSLCETGENRLLPVVAPRIAEMLVEARRECLYYADAQELEQGHCHARAQGLVVNN
jgi:hypothetical protein